MQGRSVWPALTSKNGDAEHRDDVYCELLETSLKDGSKGAQATMVRTRDYKLVVFHGEEVGELYDLRQDPSEHDNKWADSAYNAVKGELLLKLCDRTADTVDPLPERLAKW